MKKSSPTPLVAAADGVVDAVVGLVWVVVFVTMVGVGLATLIVGVGAYILAAAVLMTASLGAAERRRAASVHRVDGVPGVPDADGRPSADATRVRTPRRGLLAPLAQALLDLRGRQFWRDVTHLVVTFVLGVASVWVLAYVIAGGLAHLVSPLLPAGDGASAAGSPSAWSDALFGWNRLPTAVSIAVGVVSVALGCALLAAAHALHRTLSRSLLRVDDGEVLRQQLRAASEQRDGAVRAVESDRRRIERDLHDGVQPQLVNVGMLLSMARSKLDTDPELARSLLEEAHSGTRTAVHDLRMLGRGIHPSILTDSGLDAALSALVAQFALPVTLDVRLPGRCGQAAEDAAYFTVAEALTNAVKHAEASGCVVRVRRAGPAEGSAGATLTLTVADNGRGGAVILPRGGLAGVRDRLAAVGGRLDVASSPGGTIVSAVIPCA